MVDFFVVVVVGFGGSCFVLLLFFLTCELAG